MRIAAVLAIVFSAGCQHTPAKKIIVFGVDGMDPTFVERHWADLPALDQLRREGTFSRLATTNPPQSPVAWSSFITGLEPGEHGIFDFVQRDPLTHELYLSISHTAEPTLRLPLGPYLFPLRGGGVETLRTGRPFWEELADRGVPVSIVHMPANFPPSKAGEELSGMGTPDLRGTQGTYTELTAQGDVQLEGPPNTLRRDRAKVTVSLRLDVDVENAVARVRLGENEILLNEGEWSGWLPVTFPLIPHLAGVKGMVRVFAKQLHPKISVYVSPVNIDPTDAALPISSPPGLAKQYAEAIGRYATLGIPQDTTALRNGIITHAEFLAHTRSILNTERRLLTAALGRFKGGLLFFYFSSIDQNSHILWGKYDDELLGYYRAVDEAITDTRLREPSAQIIVMSDHGFTTFDRAVNINTWLRQEGLQNRAQALGLNGLYVSNPADIPVIRQRLLRLTDAGNNNRPAIATVAGVVTSRRHAAVAPSMEIGYARGYRASWATALGQAGSRVFETNTDAWLADHCVDPALVPGVLFTPRGLNVKAARITDLGSQLKALF